MIPKERKRANGHNSLEQKYLALVNSFSSLSRENEQELARAWQTQKDEEARQQLITSHLKFVAGTASRYEGYGLPSGDLIQEGTIGLIKAVDRFDPELGNRLVTYALPWTRYQIHEYVINNVRQVKIATTHAQQKLFFRLRSLRPYFDKCLTKKEMVEIAELLCVREEDVKEMELRLIYGKDIPFSHQDEDSNDPYSSPESCLVDDQAIDPADDIDQNFGSIVEWSAVRAALDLISPIKREIIYKRILCEEKTTLEELGSSHGVTAERIRQIELKALRDLRRQLQKYLVKIA